MVYPHFGVLKHSFYHLSWNWFCLGGGECYAQSREWNV